MEHVNIPHDMTLESATFFMLYQVIKSQKKFLRYSLAMFYVILLNVLAKTFVKIKKMMFLVPNSYF